MSIEAIKNKRSDDDCKKYSRALFNTNVNNFVVNKVFVCCNLSIAIQIAAA